MRTQRLILSVALLFVGGASAQLAGQTTTVRAQWNTLEAPALANAFVYTLRDGATLIPFSGAVQCTAAASGGGSVCTVPIAPLAAGAHTLTITACSAVGCATSDPTSGTTPAKPSTLTITITVSVS